MASWTAVLGIFMQIVGWIRKNVASGPMTDFRTKKGDKWVKGNIFADEDAVVIINIGGLTGGLWNLGKTVKDAVDDDESE